MHALARFYRDGLGVQADLVEAYAWYLVAQSNFNPQDAAEAEVNRTEAQSLAARLTPAQRDQAAVRVEQLQAMTSPPAPEKRLAPNETRI